MPNNKEKIFKRPLTSAQSESCANAEHKRCTCRCGGLLHGVNHDEFIRLEEQAIREFGYITESQVADMIAFLKE